MSTWFVGTVIVGPGDGSQSDSLAVYRIQLVITGTRTTEATALSLRAATVRMSQLRQTLGVDDRCWGWGRLLVSNLC